MSLDWNLKNVKDQSVCWRTATENNIPIGEEKGKQYMTALTQMMIYVTMAVDIGEITVKNAEEFYGRVVLLEKLRGARLKKWDASTKTHVDRYITPADVRAHIGLTTNVSKVAFGVWIKRLAALAIEDAQREYYDDLRAVESERVVNSLVKA